MLDAFGGLEPLLRRRGAAFDAMRDAARASSIACDRTVAERDARLELVDVSARRARSRRRSRPGEDEELAAPRQVLASAERVERLCAESYAALYESDDAVLAALGGVWQRVGELAALDPQFQPYLDARDGIKSQLEDLALFLRRYADGIEASPARLQQVEERLALLERLKRKYGPTLADVIARRDALRRELGDLERRRRSARASSSASCAAARAALPRRGADAVGGAAPRGARRSRSALEALLAELAMEQTRFEVRFDDEPLPEPAWTRARHRRGRVLRLAEPRRGPAAAGADRLRRRAVARHAGASRR